MSREQKGATHMDMLVLSQSEVHRCLDPDVLLGALAEGFKALSDGMVSSPERSGVSVPGAGLLLAMSAHRPGQPMAVKLVTVFPNNERRGLPGHQALICIFDPETGTPVCVMDGTFITALRTAGAAALSTRLLARSEARVLAILGAGVQGRSHLLMLPRVRDFTEIRIASRDARHAASLATTDPRARVVESFEDAVRGADVICLCTASGQPVIELDWLAPGAHVTSVGYAPPAGELPRAVIEHGQLFVETRLAFAPPPTGCGELTGLDPSTGTELGEVLLGRRPGRQSDHALTVYKSMGHASEDLAAASVVYQRAQREHIGRTITL